MHRTTRIRRNVRTTSLIAATALAAALLVGCGSKSSDSAPTTAATADSSGAITTAAGASGAAGDFCTSMQSAMNGLIVLGTGTSSADPNSAVSLFQQLGTYLDQIAPTAPDGLGPDLTTMAASFRKAADAVTKPGSENALADPAYLAATKHFVRYYTTECQPPSGS